MTPPGDGHRFARTARLRRRPDYLAVQERGRRFAGGHYLLFALRQNLPERVGGTARETDSALGQTRVGITVSRKIGTAVVRNRVKRWVRESVRHLVMAAPRGFDLVVVARPGAAAAGQAQTTAELASLLRRLDGR